MQAAVLDARRNVRIQEKNIGELVEDYVRVRVSTVGICGSDMSEFVNAPLLTPLVERHPVTGHRGPIILGHEFSGVIESIGAGVEGLAVGQAIVCGTSASCGKCKACQQGATNRCPEYWAIGLQRDGGLAEYCDIPAKLCFPYNTNVLSPDTAALAQPLAIAIHSMRRGTPETDENVAIIGAGGVGMFLIAALRELTDVGSITVIEPNVHRQRIALKMGADRSISAHTARNDATFDLIYETSGSARGLQASADLATSGGKIVLTGLQTDDQSVSAFTRTVTLRELTILGSMATVIATDFPDAIKVLAGPFDWSLLAPFVYPLKETPQLLDGSTSVQTAPVKVLISPSAEQKRAAVHYRKPTSTP